MDPTFADPADVPIDRASLVGRCMDDAGFACLILGKFQAGVRPMADRVAAAVAAGDAAEMARSAHALKGAAANLSAGALQAAAARIEQAGGHPDVVAVALADVRYEVERCLAYVPLLVADLRRPIAA